MLEFTIASTKFFKDFIKALLKAVIKFFVVKYNLEQVSNLFMFLKQGNYHQIYMSVKKYCILKYVKRKTKANLQILFYFFFNFYF